MDNKIKIKKLPKEYDPNYLIKEEIKKKNMTCPFCGETRKYDFSYCYESNVDYGVEYFPLSNTCRYGKQIPWYKHIFDKSCWWYRMCFKCHTCRAEWESEEYPKIEY